MKEFKIFIDEVDKEMLEEKETEEIDLEEIKGPEEDDFDWVWLWKCFIWIAQKMKVV